MNRYKAGALSLHTRCFRSIFLIADRDSNAKHNCKRKNENNSILRSIFYYFSPSPGRSPHQVDRGRLSTLILYILYYPPPLPPYTHSSRSSGLLVTISHLRRVQLRCRTPTSAAAKGSSLGTPSLKHPTSRRPRQQRRSSTLASNALASKGSTAATVIAAAAGGAAGVSTQNSHPDADADADANVSTSIGGSGPGSGRSGLQTETYHLIEVCAA